MTRYEVACLCAGRPDIKLFVLPQRSNFMTESLRSAPSTDHSLVWKHNLRHRPHHSLDGRTPAEYLHHHPDIVSAIPYVLNE